MELKINQQMKLPDNKNSNQMMNHYITKVDICEHDEDECYPYIHVKFYRKYENEKGDKYSFLHNENTACFTWITSNPSDGAYITALKSDSIFNYDVVCTAVKEMECTTNINQQQQQQIEPEEAHHVDIPDEDFNVPQDGMYFICFLKQCIILFCFVYSQYVRLRIYR